MTHHIRIDAAVRKLRTALDRQRGGPTLLVGDDYASFECFAVLARGLAPDYPIHALRLAPGYELPTHRMSFVHGLEYLGEADLRAMLTSLNRQRDVLPSLVRPPVVFVARSVIEAFMRMCPDLFSVREYMAEVEVEVPPELLTLRSLAGRVLRRPRASGHVALPLCQFAPLVEGREGRPNALEHIVARLEREQPSLGRPWLVSEDLELVRGCVDELARARASTFVERRVPGTRLIVPSALLDADLRARIGEGLGDRLLVIAEPNDEPEALLGLHSDLRVLVVADVEAPAGSSFAPWVSVVDRERVNRQSLREAGLDELALWRLEELGLLCMHMDGRDRIAAALEANMASSLDDLALVELVIPRRSEAQEEAEALARWLDGPPEHDVGCLAERVLLATRALLRDDREARLIGEGLLDRPRIIEPLRLALGRRFHTHGDAWWQTKLAPLLATLELEREARWRERACLVIAAFAAATSGFAGAARADLHRHALALEVELYDRAAALEVESDTPTPDSEALDLLREALRAALVRMRRFDAAEHRFRRGQVMPDEPPTMTPQAKRRLAAIVRALRSELLVALRDAIDSAYRPSLALKQAGLRVEARRRRTRIEAWIKARQQAASGGTARDFWSEAAHEAAYTLFNRVFILRMLEARGMRAPAVVSKGYASRGYLDFREVAPALVSDDASEGYEFLLELVFAELAIELPGLYGRGSIADLVPIPARTLRNLVEALDDPELESCWADDMTLGWVYQYWNDPERERLDAKLAEGGKVEPHEIASKTQMFTERYMVEWLLHNSLGPLWLAICKQHGWAAEVESSGTLRELERRRAAWRADRAAARVDASELMPLTTPLERQWAYYVEQPIPPSLVDTAPASIRDVRLLDPAVGSGHFLVVAFDLLFALHHEEARHRGEVAGARWVDRAIVERILEHNLAGVDLDARAVQIAAASLWIKARMLCPDMRPKQLQLVASRLELGRLRDDDPALVELREAVQREANIPARLTDQILHALRGADHLGSLLRVDEAVKRAIETYELERRPAAQLNIPGVEAPPEQLELGVDEESRKQLEQQLEAFLAKHAGGEQLGIRLHGRELSAGVRFIRIVQSDSYDLVVGNPPYQGTSKLASAREVQDLYPRGKADLYAAFLLRALELARPGGLSALLTMRNWMFIKQYAELRTWLLEHYDLRAIGDFDRGAFEDIPDEVVSVAVSVFRKAEPAGAQSVAIQPTPPDDRSRDGERTKRKRAATRVAEAIRFSVDRLAKIAESPIVFWWSPSEFDEYHASRLVGSSCPARFGLTTGGNDRFCRLAWETSIGRIGYSADDHPFVPLVHGAKGERWFESFTNVIGWKCNGLEVKVKSEFQYGTVSKQIRNEDFYFAKGIAFSAIGNDFAVRAHSVPAVFSNVGLSLFPQDVPEALACLASSKSRRIINDIAPGMRFDVGDVNRLPLFPIAGADTIFATLETAFGEHESHREPSVEFRRPGPSPWTAAQAWAQRAVDRPEGAPLPAYAPQYEPEPPTDHLSFALGVALGRFSGQGEGILDPATASLAHALPAGLLFLDGTLEPHDARDGLGHAACAGLHEAWRVQGSAIAERSDLRTWLRLDAFGVHRAMYENRPIHWPLASSSRTFVAFVNIHRFTAQTLQVLLADHLRPLELRMEGELADLRSVREGGDKKAGKAAGKLLDKLRKAREELGEFIAEVQRCADAGPPPSDAKCPAREQDARYAPDLDDGVMINAAALWPLLLPHWKDPKKWWKELASADGKRDYDWSHLAMRYWPARVDEKCRTDPSLAVAHGCFWRYHPARAWAWELRLQHELRPEFRIEEPPYGPPGVALEPPEPDPGHAQHRSAYLRDHAAEAIETIFSEAARRLRRAGSPLASLSVREAGLWTDHAAACWALELRMIDKQAADFVLLTPDEPEARAAYVAANPSKQRDRLNLLDGHARNAYGRTVAPPQRDDPGDAED
jgi:hypothetical protein